MPPIKAKPKLVNRGPAGLLNKKTNNGKESPTETQSLPTDVPINRIALSLREAGLVVPIASLVPDPQNARVHGERNIEAIKASLLLYGQLKPIVVRKKTMVVVAGNGTLECTKLLGWTEIAASIVDITEVEAVGYGLADNRTAELAKWNLERVKSLDNLLQKASHPQVGWTKDELEVLRVTEWTPPTVGEEGGGGSEGGGSGGDVSEEEPLLVSFTPEDYAIVGKAIGMIRVIEKRLEMSQEGALTIICQEWIKKQEAGEFDDLGEGTT